MKKILKIILIALIPMIIVIGGLYIFGNIEQNKTIKEAVESFDNPYYQELAKQCGNKDSAFLKCCIASVYDMEEVGARLSTENVCSGLRADQLKCLGSYKWCVPLANVTMPEGAEMDNENDHRACEVDSDCVPATCCHATELVHKNFAPNCKDVDCTASCESPLDCGQGRSVCWNGVCMIEAQTLKGMSKNTSGSCKGDFVVCPDGYECFVSQYSAPMPDGTFEVGEQTGDLMCHKVCESDSDCDDGVCREESLIAGDTVEDIKMCFDK